MTTCAVYLIMNYSSAGKNGDSNTIEYFSPLDLLGQLRLISFLKKTIEIGVILLLCATLLIALNFKEAIDG